MLNIIWPAFIIISFLFALFTGKTNELNISIFNSASDAVNLTLTFFGTICLWSGLMKIVQETTLIDKLSSLISPIMHFLFPHIRKEDKSYKQITVNIISNILGLGNAATPAGLSAMKILQETNKKKDTLSDDMAMFIIINTASLQIIPTTVIAVRTSLNSSAPCSIIVPIWISTICADIAGIFSAKLMMRRF